MNEVVCIIWLRFTPSVFDVSILWFAAGYIAFDVFASGLKGAVMASVLDQSMAPSSPSLLTTRPMRSVGFIVAVVLRQA